MKKQIITPEQELFLNKKIMEEMGLDVVDKKVIDQDFGTFVQFKGKFLSAPQFNHMRGCINFDPYNSTILMNHLFGLFAKKYEYDTGNSIQFTYQKEYGNEGSSLVVILSNQIQIESFVYKRNTLRYIDIIMKLNGDEHPEVFLKQFDIPRQPRR